MAISCGSKIKICYSDSRYGYRIGNVSRWAETLKEAFELALNEFKS